MKLTLLVDIVGAGLMTGGIYALVGLGLNLQYGLVRVLNVAHGEFLMIGAYLTYSLHTAWGVNPLLTLLVTGPAAFAAGLVLHRLLYARLVAGSESREALESRSPLLGPDPQALRSLWPLGSSAHAPSRRSSRSLRSSRPPTALSPWPSSRT